MNEGKRGRIIWRTGKVPNEFKTGLISHIQNKGSYQIIETIEAYHF